MNADILQFFEPHMDALPIYEALENAVLRDIQPVEVRVQKTQISFYNRRMFACASFLPARKKKDRPDTWLTVTFGLDHPVRCGHRGPAQPLDPSCFDKRSKGD